MPKIITHLSKIQSEGNKPKIINEIIGRVNSNSEQISIAHMKSPKGWSEPGQKPEFDEYTYVLSGELQIETENETLVIKNNQAIICYKGEWIKYSTPNSETEYIAVCLPAFSPDIVNRD